MHKVSRFLVAAAAIGCATGLALAAEQTILGKSLTVKNPGDSTKRRVTASARETGSADTIVGNPTLAGSAGGAILEVFLSGATPSDQSFVLPQGTSVSGKAFWRAAGTTGFKYKDGKGEQGPVTSVIIRRSPSGVFTMKAKVQGKNGPVTVIPPNPGTSGCVALKLGVAGPGDRYSLQFGVDSQIKNVDSRLFKAKKPLFEGVCPGGGPTTTTTTTPTTSTTSTTMYGSPSRAFLTLPASLLD